MAGGRRAEIGIDPQPSLLHHWIRARPKDYLSSEFACDSLIEAVA
jgi:hypothetical protein